MTREKPHFYRRSALAAHPEVEHPIPLPPRVVSLLVVTDGDFTLTESLTARSYVRFEITQAYRCDFRFDTTDLNVFDQIWIFDSAGTPRLDQTELKAISQFMDSGGGVFASGDVAGLCGSIPRVRNMRDWNARPTPNSDGAPQDIVPVMYGISSPVFFRKTVQPHPLLCSPNGVIRCVPGESQLGECGVPPDLTSTFTFDGYATTEYPTLPCGSPLAPEVIARTSNFGAVAVYDGHRVNVGRVVVSSAAHTAALFHNIAVWLARPAAHRCMLWNILWAARWDRTLLTDLRPFRDLKELDLHELLRTGLIARDVLGRYASQCQSYVWILDWLSDMRVGWPIEPIRPLPQHPERTPEIDPFVYYYTQVLVEASLGALIYTIAARFREAQKADASFANPLMEQAARLAESHVLRAARQSAKQFQQHIG